MPKLFRSIRTAASGIDPDDDGFYIIVVHQSLEVFANILGNDLVLRRHQRIRNGSVDDIAPCVVDSDLISFLFFLDILHVGDRYLRDIVILVKFQAFLDLSLYLVSVEETVHHFPLYQGCWIIKCERSVGIGIQGIDADLPAGRDCFQDIVPKSVDICCDLCAVGIAHLILGEHLCGTLILAHLDDLEADSKFCQQVLDIHWLCANACPIDHPLWVQVYFVGNRG